MWVFVWLLATLRSLCHGFEGIAISRRDVLNKRGINPATGEGSGRLLRQRTIPRTTMFVASCSDLSHVPDHDTASNGAGVASMRLDGTGASLLGDESSAPGLSSPVELYNCNIRYDVRSALTYDPVTGRYLDADELQLDKKKRLSGGKRKSIIRKCFAFLHKNFVPEGVTPSYYRFMRWRILQRFMNANVHVIGTQSLLMGLRGMQRSALVSAAAKGGTALGAVAATNWVLKDTLGKLVRMAWASKMGRKFDSDAKRWRYRACFIYALGNGLEVSTYLHPRFFLILAMLANSCKQVSMLTSSATRNALYNSFRRMDDDEDLVVTGSNSTLGSTTNGGRRRGVAFENIGDITAKGEAQIAVVDLLGIASGICLSRAIGVSVQNVLTVWSVLQLMEIFCMYHEIRSIVYQTLNFERMYTVLGRLLSVNDESGVNGESCCCDRIPTPDQIAAEEKVFLPPDHLGRKEIAFGSAGRSVLSPGELDVLIHDVFRGERFFLAVGADEKNKRGLSALFRQVLRQRKGLSGLDPQEQCHIVLHAEADNLDILKSCLALCVLRQRLVAKSDGGDNFENIRTMDCIADLRYAKANSDVIFPQLLDQLTRQGWRPPLRSMLGRVSARAEWAIDYDNSDL